MASEGEKQGKINIAEGYKQKKILEGQGKAELITQEARSIVQSLKSLGESIKRDDDSLSDSAIRLRLAESYVKTMHEIFDKSNIIVLPKQLESHSQNPFSSTNIATAMSIYKSMQQGGSNLLPADD